MQTKQAARDKKARPNLLSDKIEKLAKQLKLKKKAAAAQPQVATVATVVAPGLTSSAKAPEKQPAVGMRYNSSDMPKSGPARGPRHLKEHKYIVASTMLGSASRGTNLRVRSEARLEDARKTTPNSTKSKSQSSAPGHEKTLKRNEASVKSLNNLYFTKKQQTSQYPLDANPKLAATLDPRDFNRHFLLTDSSGPVNLEFAKPPDSKRSSSNVRAKDRDAVPGQFAKVNNFLTADEQVSPRHLKRAVRENNNHVAQSINSNTLQRTSISTQNLYYEMDLRTSANHPKTALPANTFYSSVRNQSAGGPPLIQDPARPSNTLRSSHPEQIFSGATQIEAGASQSQDFKALLEAGGIPGVRGPPKRSSSGAMLKARKQATDDSQRSEVVHSLTALETTNHKVRGTFSQIALSMNGLMAACLKAKQGYEQPKRVWLNGYLQEITAIVEELNAGINEVQYHLLESDDNLIKMKSQVSALVNQYASKDEQKTLQKRLDHLNDMHQSLTLQMQSQTAENKKLRASMKRNQDQVHDQQYMQTFAIENLEKMLAEARSENKSLTLKLDILQKSLADEAPNLKWMATSEKLMDQSSKFLVAMKKLQRVVSKKGNDKAEGDHIQTPKQQFEMHKKLLEQVIQDTQRQLADVNFEQAKKDSDESNLLKQHIKYLDDQLRQSKARAEELGQTLKLRDAQMKEFKANQPSLDLHHRDLGTQTDPAEAKSEAGVQTSSDPLFGHEAASVKPESVSASHQSMDTFKSLAQLRSNLRDLEVQKEQLHQQLKTQDSALKNLRDQNRALSTQLEMVKEQQKDDEDKTVSRQEFESLAAAATDAKTALDKAKAEHEVREYELENQLAELKQRIKTLIVEAQDKEISNQQMEYKLTKLQDQLKAKVSEAEEVSEQRARVLAEAESLKLQLQAATQRAEQAELQAQSHGRELETIRTQLAQQLDREAQLDSDLTALKQQLAQHNEVVQAKDKKVQELQSELDERKHTQHLLALSAEESERRFKEKEAAEKRVKEELEKLKRSTAIAIDELAAAKAELQQKNDELAAKLSALEATWEESKAQETEAQRKTEVEQDEVSEDVQIFKAKIRELEVQCAELAAQKDDANQKLTKQHKHSKELSIQINQLTDDLNEAEQIRNKHQQTLEKNRDLIQLLKEQLQKSVDKQKRQDVDRGEVKQQKIDLLQGEIAKQKKENEKLQQQNETLKEQVVQLKLQFQEKMGLLSGQIDDLQHEKGRQDELINDANTAIEELTLEKHDYAAKLKHLMQVYVLNLSQSQDRSSYKGDDSSLSINDCFCKIQNKFEQGRLVDNGVDLGQLLDLVREDGSTENKENEGVNGKQDLLKHKQAVKGMADRLGHVEEVLQMQNELVDQHIQKMEAAKLKLENYKARLAEKEHQAQGLQLRVKVLEEQAIELNQDKLIQEQAFRQMKEGQSLVEAQIAELRAEALQWKGKVDLKESQIQQKERENLRLNGLVAEKETKINELIVALTEVECKKPDQSNRDSSKGSQLEQLEFENMELLAKLASAERDLQELRRSQESRNMDPLDSSRDQKPDPITLQKLDEISVAIDTLHNQLFLAKSQVVSKITQQFEGQIAEILKNLTGIGTDQIEANTRIKLVQSLKIQDEIYLIVLSIDDGNLHLVRKTTLTPAQESSISNFNPGYFNDSELPNHFLTRDQNINKSEVPNEHMDQFLGQVREARVEQQELRKELNELKRQVENGEEFEVEKDMKALRDDVQFFTAENLELRLKIKALVLQNLEQKQRITELISMKQEVAEEKGFFNLSAITSSQNPSPERIEKQIEEGSIISADHIQLFNNSSVDNSSNREIRMSHIEVIEAIPNDSISIVHSRNIHQITQTLTSQNNVTVLEQQLKDANTRIKQLVDELQEIRVNPEVFSQGDQLGQVFDQAPASSQQHENLNASNLSNDSQSFKNLLAHIKGTLIMFLKKTPIVDLQNEILLQIIFSILNFSEAEKQELKDRREELPTYVIDQSKTKKAKKEREAKKGASSVVSHQSSGSTEDKHAYFSKNEIKDKMKQGVFGLFKRDNSKASRANELTVQHSGNKYISDTSSGKVTQSFNKPNKGQSLVSPKRANISTDEKQASLGSEYINRN